MSKIASQKKINQLFSQHQPIFQNPTNKCPTCEELGEISSLQITGFNYEDLVRPDYHYIGSQLPREEDIDCKINYKVHIACDTNFNPAKVTLTDGNKNVILNNDGQGNYEYEFTYRDFISRYEPNWNKPNLHINIQYLNNNPTTWIASDWDFTGKDFTEELKEIHLNVAAMPFGDTLGNLVIDTLGYSITNEKTSALLTVNDSDDTLVVRGKDLDKINRGAVDYHLYFYNKDKNTVLKLPFTEDNSLQFKNNNQYNGDIAWEDIQEMGLYYYSKDKLWDKTIEFSGWTDIYDYGDPSNVVSNLTLEYYTLDNDLIAIDTDIDQSGIEYRDDKTYNFDGRYFLPPKYKVIISGNVHHNTKKFYLHGYMRYENTTSNWSNLLTIDKDTGSGHDFTLDLGIIPYNSTMENPNIQFRLSAYI